MTYAIISVGGKQHRVREGQWLLVDRLPFDEGATFQPQVLLVGGDGETLLGADEIGSTQVTVRVSEHLLGKKVIVGKHKQRTGYRRRNGFRARLSKIEIESIGASKPARTRKAKSDDAAPAEPALAESGAAASEPAAKPRARKKATEAKDD